MPYSTVQSGSETRVMPWRWSGWTASLRIREGGVYIAISLGVVVLCGVQTIALRGNPHVADAIGYFCYSVTFWALMGVSLAFARRDVGKIRWRWLFFAGAQGATAIYFTLPVLQWASLMPWKVGQFWGTGFNALNHSLILLAATMWFSGALRRMAAIDAVQASVAGILQFAVIFAPRTHDLFTENHLAVSTGIAAFLFLTALTASLGAASAAESRFLRLLTLFLGLQTFGSFLMNQVSYVWLHHKLASIWDVPETLFNLAFLAIALRTMNGAVPDDPDPRPTIFIRNLMPSFLALGNVALGLLILSRYQVVGVTAILVAVMCYMLRTVMLQGQSAQERESLHRLNQHLEELAGRDMLTGAGNRRSLISAMAHLSRSQSPTTFALLLIDTDEFKQANDQFGHLFGDEVLIAIADVLRDAAESVPDSHCARFGGDEFALLLPNLDPDAAYAFAENLRLRVRELALGDGEHSISISLGGTVSTLSADLSFERLLSRADSALYLAKSLGRNRVEMSLG